MFSLLCGVVFGCSGLCGMTVAASARYECKSASNWAYDDVARANSSYDRALVLLQIGDRNRSAGGDSPFVYFAEFFAAKALPGRNGAFRAAKDAAGIPRSAQPNRTFYERLYDQPGNVRSRVYEFQKADGSVVTIREHSLGHMTGGQGPHFNVELRPPGGGPRQPLPGGGDGHYYFEP